MAQDRGARRRHPLAADAVVQDLEAGQQLRRRRRRHRQGAVRGPDPAGAERQGSGGPTFHHQAIDQIGGTDDVGDRVPVGELVKMYLVDRDAVYRRFRLGQMRQDGDRAVDDRGFESRSREPGANFAKGAGRSALARFGRADLEAGTGEDAVVRGPGPDGPVVRQTRRPHRRLQAPASLGPSIEESGQEHVAADPAQGIEVDVPGGLTHVRSNSEYYAAGRQTGTR